MGWRAYRVGRTTRERDGCKSQYKAQTLFFPRGVIFHISHPSLCSTDTFYFVLRHRTQTHANTNGHRPTDQPKKKKKKKGAKPGEV